MVLSLLYTSARGGGGTASSLTVKDVEHSQASGANMGSQKMPPIMWKGSWTPPTGRDERAHRRVCYSHPHLPLNPPNMSELHIQQAVSSACIPVHTRRGRVSAPTLTTEEVGGAARKVRSGRLTFCVVNYAWTGAAGVHGNLEMSPEKCIQPQGHQGSL